MKLLTFRELSLRLGLSVPTVKKMDRMGQLPGRVKLCSRIKFRADAIEKFILGGGALA
jgi:predicted DNA-binding transcriptional regulator AlpA